MEGWGGLSGPECGSTERETDAEYVSSNGPPLTRAEKLAAFMAYVHSIDDKGLSPGYARISAESEHSIDITFTLSSFAVRAATKGLPAAIADAERYLAGK